MNMAAFASSEWAPFSEQIDQVKSLVDVYDLLKALAESARFRHFSVMRFSKDLQGKFVRELVFTSLPDQVLRDYESSGLADESRAFTLARHSVKPYVWDRSDGFHLEAGNDNRSGSVGLTRAGVRMGISIPVHSARADRGLVVLGGDRETPDMSEIALLTLMANCLFDRLSEIEATDDPAAEFRLTGRERQCLIWTSAGKTSSEIATILGLSEHTVNQYITSSCQKLGAVNRTHAVAKSIRLQLID